MTIRLPEDLERFIRAEVQCGHFATEDEAIAEAVRLLRLQQSQSATTPAATNRGDPVLGVLRDAADELDEVVAEAMSHREQQPWRLAAGE
jgi:Arc/MetJ-type ribon-helix-helix transcriptional regulator